MIGNGQPAIVQSYVMHATRETLSASRIALLEDLRANSKQLVDGRVSYLLSAPAIHCGNCISTIEDNVTRIEGVTDVRANLTMKRVAVTLDNESRSLLPVVQALESLGYATQSLTSEEAGGSDPEFKVLLRSLAVSGFAIYQYFSGRSLLAYFRGIGRSPAETAAPSALRCVRCG